MRFLHSLVAPLYLSSCANDRSTKALPGVDNGIINSTNRSIEEDCLRDCKGKWSYAWRFFFEAQDIETIGLQLSLQTMVPSLWREQGNRLIVMVGVLRQLLGLYKVTHVMCTDSPTYPYWSDVYSFESAVG